jgi:23S rRNA (adenine-N6)-dimethyltransferase
VDHPLWRTQNFLRHPRRIERLLDLSSIRERDIVLDLGAGDGQLTAPLADRCRRVIAVEKDPLLATSLAQRFAGNPRVVIRHADALAVRLPRAPYKVVANIPFDITTRLVRRLTSSAYPPEDSYLVMQAEAAQRIVGEPRATLFGLLLQPWFAPSVVHHFARNDFNPPPRVDVVFLRLRKRGPPLVRASDAQLYVDLLSVCFLSAQRTPESALAPVLGHGRLQKLARTSRIPPSATPSSMRLSHWLALVNLLSQDAEARSRLAAHARLLRHRLVTIRT